VPLDRFNAFSDGVFAIAITLLVLELTVPEGPEGLLAALVEQWPEFLGYLISFAFIGGSWQTHARMTRLMKRGDNVLAASLLLTFLMAHLVRERALLVDDVADETLAAMTRQRRISNGLWIIAVVCALASPGTCHARSRSVKRRRRWRGTERYRSPPSRSPAVSPAYSERHSSRTIAIANPSPAALAVSATVPAIGASA
jgi:hypothetical protein